MVCLRFVNINVSKINFKIKTCKQMLKSITKMLAEVLGANMLIPIAYLEIHQNMRDCWMDR